MALTPMIIGCGQSSACTAAKRTKPSSAVPKAVSNHGGRELPAGDVLVMGDEVIHWWRTPDATLPWRCMSTGGFFSAERSDWDFETFEERPRDFERIRRLFDEANARWLQQPNGGPAADGRPREVSSMLLLDVDHQGWEDAVLLHVSADLRRRRGECRQDSGDIVHIC